ncbi:MAG: hypothetical protein H7Y30_06725 [Pyrinomonadaceae bacterium]|nr:hypothetical protein [Pyrinomonadaceae bacterium]
MTACRGTENKTPDAPVAATPQSPAASPDADAAPEKTPPENVVQAEAPSADLMRSARANVPVRVTIAKGYHINANPPSFPYLIATELTVEPKAGFVIGKPVYPASVTRKFAFSKDPLAVYEGNVVIKMPISIAEGKPPYSEHGLNGKLRYQACDDDTCFPPNTLDVNLHAVVK